MVHRALMGSVERFFGVLLEHYAGALPGWLAPVQARSCGCRSPRRIRVEVAATLRRSGLRVDVDQSHETVGEKIRRALTAKHPAVLVVGDADVEAGTVGLRLRGEDEERGVGVAVALERPRPTVRSSAMSRLGCASS